MLVDVLVLLFLVVTLLGVNVDQTDIFEMSFICILLFLVMVMEINV